MNPKILKLPGMGKEQFIEYRKNGCFNLNGEFYSNEMCTIRLKINTNVLILDIPEGYSLENILNDNFIEMILFQSNPEYSINVFIHMSHPSIISDSLYKEFILKIGKIHPKAEHVYCHPFYSQTQFFDNEKNGVYGNEYSILKEPSQH